MDFKGIFLDFCIITTLIFGLIGAIFVGTIAHEYSHYLDFKEYADPETDGICVMNIPTPLNWSSLANIHGSYEFFSDIEYSEEIDEMTLNSEIKAYTISIFIAVFYLFIALIVYIYFERAKVDEWLEEQRIK